MSLATIVNDDEERCSWWFGVEQGLRHAGVRVLAAAAEYLLRGGARTYIGAPQRLSVGAAGMCLAGLVHLDKGVPRTTA